MTGSVFDYVFDVDKGRWEMWADRLPNFNPTVHVSDVSFADVIVPTQTTESITYVMQRLLESGNNVAICGGASTGKSSIIRNFVTKRMKKNETALISVNFSPTTDTKMTQQLIRGHLERHRRGVYGTTKSHYNIQCSEIFTLVNEKFHTET